MTLLEMMFSWQFSTSKLHFLNPIIPKKSQPQKFLTLLPFPNLSLFLSSIISKLAFSATDITPQLYNNKMNNLAYNPSERIIQQWRQIYFTAETIDSFQTIIDRTHMYLEIIKNYKDRKANRPKKRLKSKKSLCQEEVNVDIDDLMRAGQETYNQKIEEWIKDITQLKGKLNDEHKQAAQKEIVSDNEGENGIAGRKDDSKGSSNHEPQGSKLDICLAHLQQITIQSIRLYNRFLHQQFKLIEEFVRFKQEELFAKYDKLQAYLSKDRKQVPMKNVKTIFANLYIQTDYLKKLVLESHQIFKLHTNDKEFSTAYDEINQIRDNFIDKLVEMEEKVEEMKERLRKIYFNNFRRKRSGTIRNHQKLERIICREIAVNAQEYQENTTVDSFINGFIFAFLICALIAIIIFRFFNLSSLESDTNYLRDFKIWRGASYLIYFNWILGIVFMLCKKYRINYRMILIEEDTFIPKHQAFFFTASVLSAVYLTLFMVYLLFKLNMISGSGLENLGMYMWIINLAFLLNPFKILNYQGRKYFIIMLYKVIMTLIRPMNMNIFFLAIIIGSFVQPFGDLAFTTCQAVYLYGRDCQIQTRNATFIFTMIFLFYRFVQSIRSHRQFGDRCYSRPLIGITAVVFSMNTVISSYFYNLYPTDELRVYWLISAACSTIAGIQADLRADWGFLGIDKGFCLRRFIGFPRMTYYILIPVDIVLNIGWVLTISNNLSENVGINTVYFLMILSYVELARKGMWAFFRIEDDHSANVGFLRAVNDDSHLYAMLESEVAPKESNNNVLKESSQKIVFEASLESLKKGANQSKMREEMEGFEYIDREATGRQEEAKCIAEFQQMVLLKKQNRLAEAVLIKELNDYLNIIHEIYSKLEWEDEY